MRARRARLLLGASMLRARPTAIRCERRSFCTGPHVNGTPHSVLGLPLTASQQDIRKRYLELAKKTHPDVASPSIENDNLFKRVQTAYEQLSQNSGQTSVSQPASWTHAAPASPGARAYRKQQGGMAMVGLAMQLAEEGRKSEALDHLLPVITELAGPLPGHAQKAVLHVFDIVCSPSLHRVEHAKCNALWRWLLESDAVDAQACEAFKWACLRTMRPIEAWEAYRVATSRAGHEGFARNPWRDLP